MKKQNGITLVTLIITIIVMTILAGVVIVTAVMDGGILDRAQTAMIENERAEVEDIVIASYVYKTTASTNIIGQLDLEETAKAIYSNLIESNYKVKTTAGAEAQRYEEIYTQGATSINLNVEGKQGTYTGTVEKNGLRDGMKIVEDTGNGSVNPELPEEPDVPVANEELEVLRNYFLGRKNEQTGERPTVYITDLVEDVEVDDFKNIKFVDNDGIVEDVENLSILDGELSAEIVYFYVKYNNNIYVWGLGNNDMISKSFDIANNYIELGANIYYSGITWKVFSRVNEYGGIQLVSSDTIGDITLGGETVEEGVASYNNAIETLNNGCANLITDKSAIAKDSQGNYLIRCFGGPFIDQDEYTEKQGYTVKEPGYKVSDTSLIGDNLGIYYSNEPEFWIAERWIEQRLTGGEYGLNGGIKTNKYNGDDRPGCLFTLVSNKGITNTKPARAIIVIDSSVSFMWDSMNEYYTISK